MNRKKAPQKYNRTRAIPRVKSDSARRVKRESPPDLTKFYGVQECLALFRHRRNEIKRVFVLSSLADSFKELIDWSIRRGIPSKLVERDELLRIAATEHHEGVCCEALPIEMLSLSNLMLGADKAPKSCILILEGVDNPHNLGAILRTGSFFGVSGVIIVSSSVSSLSGATCRVAEGAAEILPVSVVRDISEALTLLKQRGFTVMATTPHRATSLYKVITPSKLALLFGAEGTGLSSTSLSAADERVVIPRVGNIESLNVGAAVASCLAVLNPLASKAT